jgi:hypothetical protein
MFDPSDEANDSNKEWEKRGQILCVTVRVFCNDDEAGNATPNILDSPPRAVHGHVLIAGQHNQTPQIRERTIIHSVMQIFSNDTNMHPLCDPESGFSTTLSTVNMDQLLAIRNPEILLAPFAEPDFLRPP